MKKQELYDMAKTLQNECLKNNDCAQCPFMIEAVVNGRLRNVCVFYKEKPLNWQLDKLH